MKMKKAYGTYKKADVDEAKDLLASDDKKKVVVYKDGDKFRMAVSVFTKEEKGFMRHVILPETLSEICKNPQEGEKLFHKFCEMKLNGDMCYRIGSLENPTYYCTLLPTDNPDVSRGAIGLKFPFFRTNEKYPNGLDINDYVNKSFGYMSMLHNDVAHGALDNIRHLHGGRDAIIVDIVHKLEKNPDGSLPDLATPVIAPSSPVKIDFIEREFGIRPENGQYTKGLRFTPVYGMGDVCNRRSMYAMKSLLAGHHEESQAKRYGAILFSTPYIFNLRNSDGKVRHDVIIDPIQAADIVYASSALPIEDSNVVSRGVCRGSLVEYDRLPSPPLSDDTYLYKESEIIDLYANTSSESDNLSVSRVFRNPILDKESKCYGLSDISGNERVPKGRIRNVYVPTADLVDLAQGRGYSKSDSFSEANHNHYISMVTKYGYLKNGGNKTDSNGVMEAEEESVNLPDEIEF